jgi:hypothetical protein
MTEAEIAALMRGIGPVIRKFVQEQIEQRIAGLLRYDGVWSETADYGKNVLVTHRGTLWISTAASRGERPGSPNSAFKLVAKSDSSHVRRIVRAELGR